MEFNSILSVNSSTQLWVDQISKNFDDEVRINVSDVPVCVFNVPKSITRFKPEAYVPQAIALGPYHHFVTHLYQMERCKVDVVKAFLDPSQVQSFELLVIDQLKSIELELKIRACYHKYLELDGHMLAWIFAIDGLFLLNLFKSHEDMESFIPKKLMRHKTLYRDMMVLENQIPLVILKEIQKIIKYDLELLPEMIRFCKVHSPLKLIDLDINSDIESANYLHLLDLMYRLIVKNESSKQNSHDEPSHEEPANGANDANDTTINSEGIPEDLGKSFIQVGQQVVASSKTLVKPMSLVAIIPWAKIYNSLRSSIGKKSDKEVCNYPGITEIDIPSATSLSKYANIKFRRLNGWLRDTKFVATEAILYLPVITLEKYSEVVLRNLVAYEIMTSSSMELAQYVDLMSGIIDTEEDAKLLKYSGIIEGNLKSKEVVDLFNGINESNEHASCNETVKQLNEYYNKKLVIKVRKFMKKRMRCARKVLNVVFTLLACLLMIAYSFCEVYGCRRLFY